MSEEDFLSRWSRRKREAEEGTKDQGRSAEDPARASDTTEKPGLGEDRLPDGKHEQPQDREEEVDLSALPDISAITAETDITMFLRRGVPLELSRAALRRAWTADPAIRDFIGLAENAWDFNDPNAMPGFGPLDQSPEEVRQLVARIVRGVGEQVEAVGAAGQPEPEPSSLPIEAADPPRLEAVPPASQQALASPHARETSDAEVKSPSERDPASKPVDDALQNQEALPTSRRRAHGGALPRFIPHHR